MHHTRNETWVRPNTDMNGHNNLVERLRAGKIDALGDAYDLYGKGIYRFCLKILGDHDEAQDAVQEVFLLVLSDIHDLRDEERFVPWIFRIAYRECLMMIRRKKGVSLDVVDDAVWNDETPLDLASHQDLVGQVRQAIESMQPVYQHVVHLRVYEHLSYSEIAAVLDTTEAAVRARLFKARKALARKLNHLMQEGPSHGV